MRSHDSLDDALTTAADRSRRPVRGQIVNRTTAIRSGSVALTLGAATWAVTMLIAGPPKNDVSDTIEILGGFAYQVGLAGFLLAAWLTRALGTSRGARTVLGGEVVLLALASAWSIVYAIDPGTQNLAMVVLDATWPLSMLGLVPVGIYILRAGVWSAPTRKLSLVASLWLPLDVVAMLIGGDWAGLAFRAAWLTVVWGGLGVLTANQVAADERRSETSTANAEQSSVGAS